MENLQHKQIIAVRDVLMTSLDNNITVHIFANVAVYDTIYNTKYTIKLKSFDRYEVEEANEDFNKTEVMSYEEIKTFLKRMLAFVESYKIDYNEVCKITLE